MSAISLPGSAHFANLAPLWAQGDYVPMPCGADAVKAATQERINLGPG